MSLTGSGVVGLSYVPSVPTAQDSGHIGGICEPHRHYTSSPTLPTGWYSLNIVLVTQYSRGVQLANGVTPLTVAHEIGHSFGARHDNDFSRSPECLPGEDSPFGNYIMAASLPQNVDKAHSMMFSKCSRRLMAKLIASTRSSCFIRRSSSYCGNGVVEDNEQCDCGTTYTCDVYDKCCVPLSLRPHHRVDAACRLKSRSACSPRVNRCCNSACTVLSAGVTCREMTDCSLASHCDGRSASCPAPRPAADGTPCAGGRGRCKAGVCSVSVCEQAGLASCLCRQPPNHLCSVCCRCAGVADDVCVPAQWLHVTPPLYSLALAPGAACVDRGVCNSDARCVRPYVHIHAAAVATHTSPNHGSEN